MATPALARTINVQAAGVDDLDKAMQVMEAAFGTGLRRSLDALAMCRILPMAGVSLMVARDEENGATLGFSLFRNVADEARAFAAGRSPGPPPAGHWDLLLDDFLDCARRKGARPGPLEVRDGNPAVDMYRASGFAPVGRRRDASAPNCRRLTGFCAREAPDHYFAYTNGG